jgi:cytochrome oxidase Cu insertion factor (SCO1/SenC/PrrC family)
MKLRLAFLLACALLFAPLAASAQQPAIAITNLKVGEMAPDFTLLDNHWHPVKLSSFRGKSTVVVAFYILAFTSG